MIIPLLAELVFVEKHFYKDIAPNGALGGVT